MQLHLVSMLNFNRSEEAEKRLEQALHAFYLSELERMKAEMRHDGTLNEDILAQCAAEHFRTPY